MSSRRIVLFTEFVLLVVLCSAFSPSTLTVVPSSLDKRRCSTTSLFSSSSSSTANNNNSNSEAARLLEQARRIRAEAAALEGKTPEEAELEASEARKRRQAAIEEDREKQRRRAAAAASAASSREARKSTDGRFLELPETADDQVLQARGAVERAYRDGISRQIVRMALIPEGEVLNQGDRQWPGGAKQMYREAAGPLTRELLRLVRTTEDPDAFPKPPTVKSQDIWDFDGSANVWAEAESGPKQDVRALVQPNTDTKYTNDIDAIDQAMKGRLFLIVNPFWKDVESWGFNLLAPNAKKHAQEVIFDRCGFQETYVLLQKSVRGEDCVALKAYPYDWQVYAYCERDEWPYDEYTIRIGSSKEEPSIPEIASMLEQRDEFRMSKNMRQMQRVMNRGDR